MTPFLRNYYMLVYPNFRFIEDMGDHFHNPCKAYPTGAAGVTITASDSAAWTLGSYAEVVPASTIGALFDIHHINIEGASAEAGYELVLYASTTEIGRIRLATVDIANATLLPSMPFQSHVLPADTQIQAKLMSSTGDSDTLTISTFYHTY